MYGVYVVVIIYLLILLQKKRMLGDERKYIAEKVTKKTETGELLLSFRDEKCAKKARGVELGLYLLFYSLLIPLCREFGTSREVVVEGLGLATVVNLGLFIAMRITRQVRLIEVFSTGIKITQGPTKLFSAELHEYSTNRFYHFSKNDFSELDEPGVLKILFFEDEVVIDSPEIIETIVEAYENFRAEEEE